jgi:phage tail-like protein
MANPEIHTVSHFLVTFDGVIESHAGFAEVSGLGIEIAEIEYREGSDKAGIRKIPGLAKYSNITLKRGVTSDLSLWTWMREVLNGNTIRSNGRIQLLNERREPVRTWRVRNAWPSKYVGPTFQAAGNDVAIETLELCHEGLEIES